MPEGPGEPPSNDGGIKGFPGQLIWTARQTWVEEVGEHGPTESRGDDAVVGRRQRHGLAADVDVGHAEAEVGFQKIRCYGDARYSRSSRRDSRDARVGEVRAPAEDGVSDDPVVNGSVRGRSVLVPHVAGLVEHGIRGGFDAGVVRGCAGRPVAHEEIRGKIGHDCVGMDVVISFAGVRSAGAVPDAQTLTNRPPPVATPL